MHFALVVSQGEVDYSGEGREVIEVWIQRLGFEGERDGW